jgi:hypothetical protein
LLFLFIYLFIYYLNEGKVEKNNWFEIFAILIWILHILSKKFVGSEGKVNERYQINY